MSLHEAKHIDRSAIITDIVIGMSDGLIVPFALAAGLSSVVENTIVIITIGIIAILAGAAAMGIGGYLANKTVTPEKEKQEAPDVFAEIGLSNETQKIIAAELKKDKEEWMELVRQYELDIDQPDPKRPRHSAFNIGLSYIAGGMIPLLPYFFTAHPMNALSWSCMITVICLFVFGFFKAKRTGQNPWNSAARMTLTGTFAAVIAFFIARLFD